MQLNPLLEHLKFLDASRDSSSAVMGTYNPLLVVLSVIIASIAAYSALRIVERISAAQTAKTKSVWLVTGAVTMGIGVWAMHFVGMLAFILPILVSYNIVITLVSMLPAIFASAVMLLIISRDRIVTGQLLLGGTLMGVGIGAMHYTGMAAMQTDAVMLYDSTLFVVSILVAIVLACIALSIKFLAKFRALWTQLASACIMGFAVAGMHYTGMAAAKFFPGPSSHAVGAVWNPIWLAGWVSLITVFIICVTIFVTILDQRLGTAREHGEKLERLVAGRTRELQAANAQLQIEREQRRHARQIQLIMDTVPDGVVMLAPDYQILTTNQTAQEYLKQLDAVVQQNTLHSLGGQPIDQVLAHCTGDEWEELVTDPPAKRLFEVTARAVDIDTSLEGWVVVLRDVTRERERQRYLQAQERLATVGQLAAGIAHDFNNILVIISLHTEMVLAKPSSPKATQHLQTILGQTQRATTLVAQILAFSRRSIMQYNHVDLLAFLKEMVNLLEHTLPENIRIELDAAPDMYVVKADLTQLQQVIMNLSLNARDAMPNGGLLHIELEEINVAQGQEPPLPGMHSGRWVKLVILDSGSGIQAEDLAHVFEPFFTTKGLDGGTGLGLAQVYGIVKQHQGEITLESEVGSGARFTIYLPAANVLLDSPVPEQAAFLSQGTETILLAEDQIGVREALRDVLESLGYIVLEANNGEAALQLFAEHIEEIDLVLSDMIMPGMSGADLYQELKSRNAKVKMIILSGYPLEERGRALLEEGTVGWLQKPYSIENLATRVREMLDLTH